MPKKITHVPLGVKKDPKNTTYAKNMGWNPTAEQGANKDDGVTNVGVIAGTANVG